MEWVYPHALWLMLLLPLLAWWHLRRPRPADVFTDLRLLGPISTRRKRHLVWPLLLRLFLLTVVILGLARPRWPDESARIPAQSTAIVFVLDISGSMAEADLQGQHQPMSRLGAAQEALNLFVRGDGQSLVGRQEDLLGLVPFAAKVEETDVCPPTLSHQTLLQKINSLTPKGQILENTTNIGDALAFAVTLLKGARPQAKTIILLSDGEHNVPAEVAPGALKPRQAAHMARALGIRVHTIFLSGAASAATAPQALAALRDVAAMSGGQAHQAADREALVQIYAQLDTLERTEIASHEYFRYVELYPWCGLLALGTLLLILLGEEYWWRTLP